jgi:hypothetical protein
LFAGGPALSLIFPPCFPLVSGVFAAVSPVFGDGRSAVSPVAIRQLGRTGAVAGI